MKNKDEVIKIIEILKQYYPDAKCSLDFETPFQLMIAVMLSAQCTDERVNIVTTELFNKFPTAEKMSKATIEQIEDLIKSCGFYRNKAKNILLTSKLLVKEYDSVVPQDINELEKFPGIGRKSANVIMTEAFNDAQGIAVDTHAKRISNKLGLSEKNDPKKIEEDLLKQVPKEYLKDINHLFMWLGRDKCNSRKPDCENCPINMFCDNYLATLLNLVF